MSTSILILGESGSGKSTSLRNLASEKTVLIQAVKKPLPFRNTHWQPFDKDNCRTGNIFVTDKAEEINHIMRKTRKEIIILDDFQYILANEFMRRVLDKETGNAAFAKYNEIARNAWDILMSANDLEAHKRVYILAHTQETDTGRIKTKTIGKLLDEKITIEGLFSIVLRTDIINGNYLFATQTNGNDCCKSPLGMFEAMHIDNDLAAIDTTICDYYGITSTTPQPFITQE